MQNPMNYLKVFTLILLAGLCSCSDDDSDPDHNPPPTGENPSVEVAGTVSAVVDGIQVYYPEVRVVVYGLSGTAGFIALDTVPENRTNVINMNVPLTPVTGDFDHTDPGFNVSYEVILGNAESGYTFNRERESSISILAYDSVGVSGDTTFYNVRGNFELSGMPQMSSDSVNVEDGEFDFTYKWWN